MKERILTNARIVLADQVLDRGTIVLAGEAVKSVAADLSNSGCAQDLEGDYVLPGFVELHTDNLEKHFSPRPGVKWPALDAVLAHDAQIAAAGVTTVLDALSVGDIGTNNVRLEGLTDMFEAISTAQIAGHTRAEHMIHARCEVSHDETLELFESMVGEPLLRLVSVMDHTPGQRQFTDPEQLRRYYSRKYSLTDEQFEIFIQERMEAHHRNSDRQRAAVIEIAKQHGYAMASHDDATEAHIAEAVEAGMCIAEFPTTREAARAAKRAGLAILLGAPNIVLGGSHSGNVSAADLVREEQADILSSDYVPSSLMGAIFGLAHSGIDFAAVVRMASKSPAEAVGLDDRGELAEGKRADWVRVRPVDGVPVVREVWRRGERVV
jgi:alpha-D-ribose 1-methylphosphonate 5-triphosphate diphosphatase